MTINEYRAASKLIPWELISMLETLENKGLANMVKNKSPAPRAYLCGFPEAEHTRKPKLRLSITGEVREVREAQNA